MSNINVSQLANAVEQSNVQGQPRPPQSVGIPQAYSGLTGQDLINATLAKEKPRKPIHLPSQNVPEVDTTGLVIKGLGRLDDLAKLSDPNEEEDEGEGDFLVILHDRVTGNVGQHYKQGAVVRASKLAPSWGKDENRAAFQLKRLFSLGAVRMATIWEQDTKQVMVDAFEDRAVATERAKRDAAERENLHLKQQLSMLNKEQLKGNLPKSELNNLDPNVVLDTSSGVKTTPRDNIKSPNDSTVDNPIDDDEVKF